MKTESKAVGQCLAELKVKLDACEAKAAVKKVEAEFMREVRLPGFRPGKVPLQLIRQKFGKELAQGIERRLVEEYSGKAIEAEKLDSVAITEVKEFARGEEGASYTLSVEVRPAIKLPTYKGLKIEKKDTTVTDEMLAASIDDMRASLAKYEDAKEGDAVAEGDFAQIDYMGTVDGKAISEIVPEDTVIGARNGFWMQLSEGRFVPEIIEALKGMKAGETKEGVVVVFGDEAPEALKGAKAAYTVTLKAFRRRILPDDATVAATFKEENYDALVAKVRERMERRAVEEESVRRENEAVEMLLKKVDFEVPATQVRAQRDGMLKQFAERAQRSGIDAGYFEKNADKILADAEENAVKQVKTWYLLDAIAKAENLPEGDDRFKKVLEIVVANSK